MSTFDKDPELASSPTGFRKLFLRLSSLFTGGSTTGSSIILPASAGGPAVVVKQRDIINRRGHDPEVVTRRNAVKAKLEVMRNHIAPQLDVKLRMAFHPENYARMFWVMHTSSNVMRRIVGDISTLYENPAVRRLELATTQTEGLDDAKAEADTGTRPDGTAAPQTGDPDIDALADVLELSGSEKVSASESPFDKLMAVFDLDMLLGQVEQLCMVSPVVWVRPVVTYQKDVNGENDPATGKLTYVVYTPENADIVPDPENPADALAFYYFGEAFDERGDMKRVTHFWTREKYYKLDAENRVVLEEDNELGRLPVTPFRIHMPLNGYYADGEGDDLHEATLELCLLKTLQNSRAKDSAFKQLAIQGDAKDVEQDMVLGGPSPIMLGDENTAVVLDLQANLEQFTTMWEARETSVAATYGISSAEYKSEGAPQSGFAKKLDRDKVLKENRRRRKFFAVAEQDLYHNTATLLRDNPVPQVPKLPVDAKLVVDFVEPTFEEDPQLQSRLDAIALKLNVLSILDILRRANPDVDDVTLIKLAYRNKRINAAFMTAEQLSLVDLLATRANVGGSFGKVGAEDAPADDAAPAEKEPA